MQTGVRKEVEHLCVHMYGYRSTIDWSSTMQLPPMFDASLSNLAS